MIEMTHHNDGKEKHQSHEISIRELNFYHAEPNVWSHNPFDIYGYGATKEEAIRDFKDKFAYLMSELRAFEFALFETDMIINNIIEVDCLGKPIKNK